MTTEKETLSHAVASPLMLPMHVIETFITSPCISVSNIELRAQLVRHLHFVKALLWIQFGKRKCIMDVGCGNGKDVMRISWCRPRQVCFVDMNQDCITECKDRWKHLIQSFPAIFSCMDFTQQLNHKEVVVHRMVGHVKALKKPMANHATAADASTCHENLTTTDDASNESCCLRDDKKSCHFNFSEKIPLSILPPHSSPLSSCIQIKPTTKQSPCFANRCCTETKQVMSWTQCVDVVSCHFVLQDVVKLQQTLEQFLNNVSTVLVQGGIFMGTLINAHSIQNRIHNLMAQKQQQQQPAALTVQEASPTETPSLHRDKTSFTDNGITFMFPSFGMYIAAEHITALLQHRSGVPYFYFTQYTPLSNKKLRSSSHVQQNNSCSTNPILQDDDNNNNNNIIWSHSVEYCIFMDHLVLLARKYNLHLIRQSNLAAFVSEEINNPRNQSLVERMGLYQHKTHDKLWDMLELYSMFIFVKH